MVPVYANTDTDMSKAYYVAMDGNDTNDGLSREHAKRHIQAAINVMDNVDTVYVDRGTYHENIVILKSIQLIGVNKNDVILDGDQKDRCIFKKDCNVLIRGFTITNGKSNIGGGILNDKENLKIQDSHVEGNTATEKGGGIHNTGNLIVDNSKFIGNTATDVGVGGGFGGGISNYGILTLHTSQIISNTATEKGGGIQNAEGRGLWDSFTKQNTVSNKPDNVGGKPMEDI